jgi:hypothetical protein
MVIFRGRNEVVVSTTSSDTPRIFTRGEQGEFKVGFFLDGAMTTPAVPLSPTYPQYTIYDPTGTAIQTGVGIQSTPGNWTTNWLVPKDANLSFFNQAPQQYGNRNQGEPLSYNESRYRIEWQLVTAENFQFNFTEEFDVQDVAITQSQSRELKYLTMAGDPVRVMYRTTALPYKVNMKMIIRGNDNNPVAQAYLDQSQIPVGGNLKYAVDGDSYVLYYDVPAKVTQCNTAYLVLWQIQETEFSVPTTEFQIVTSISTSVLPMMTSLRMLIDRFQKRLGRVQAFEDSDLLEYLAQGQRLVNLSYPTTSFTMQATPDDLQVLVFLAAGWYAMQAQRLLANDLQFSFSGQSVTLSVDQQAGLDGAAAAMMDMFNKQIGPAKMAYVRKARGTGTVAGRAYDYRSMYNFSYKIFSTGSGGTDQFLITLSKIGLL